MAEFSLSSASNTFKTKYGKLSENVYNSANVLLGRTKKSYNFVGKNQFEAIPKGFGGGVGSGSLPRAGVAVYEDALITSKKMYSVVQVEREAIKASANDEGAFVRATKEVVKKGVESWMRNMSRALFHDGTGSLGEFSGNAGGTAAAPTLTITSASFKEANWEESDYINVNSLSTIWEITAVNPTTRVITLARIEGSDDLTAIGVGTHTVYMQNSKNNDPSGLKGVLRATSSTLYSIPVARRWQASVQENSSGAGITTDLMNGDILEIHRKCGKVPNLIITSFKQYKKILNLLEDQKTYSLDPRSNELKGKISFKGVEFMSSAGAIPIFPERFVEDDAIYYLNDDYIEILHRPDFGWFDDDGTVFLRSSDSDSYEARYGGYLETYIIPPFHGTRWGLAV